MTIGTVLLLVFVGALSVFTLVAMAFFHMRFSNVVVNQRSARNIAESAMGTALTKIWEDQQYGSQRKANEFVHLKSETDEEAEAFLSFNSAKAAEYGVPQSTNNFDSEKAVEGGTGRSIPVGTVHIVALGQCRGATYRSELLYYVPPYPNALAASGPIKSTGGLQVAGISTVEQMVDEAKDGDINLEEMEPGHVVSNSNKNLAVFLGPNTTVRGDVIAVGGIDVSTPSSIHGELRPRASKQKIPDLDVDEIFLRLEGISTRDKILDSTLPDGHELDYFTEADKPLRVNGDLVLNGGVLYCQDDLVVNGEVRGNGAIFGRGDVRIESGAELSASDQVAVVAKGSLELVGTSNNTQFFNGLVYSEEELSARDITIVGSAVVNGTEHSELHLDNVNLVTTPLSTELVLRIPERPKFAETAALGEDDEDPVLFFTGGLFGGTKTSFAYLPPGTETRLETSLAAGLQLTGMRMPSIDGEKRYSLLFEGVYRRGLGELNDISDLDPLEAQALELSDRTHYFQDGMLFVRYERQQNVSREQVVAYGESLMASVGEALDGKFQFEIEKTRKKKALFGLIRKTKKSRTDHVFDPIASIKDMDLEAYLDSLEQPKTETGPSFLSMSLNRVFDPAESSRILFWGRL